MSYSNDMYRQIIIDHVENPRNKNKSHQGYAEYTLKNPSCGDMVTVYVKIDKNVIEDITYEVEGCSVCSASTSIMSSLFIGKTLEEAKEIITNFNDMVIGNNYDEDILGEAISLKGVATIPSRIKCATLAYKAFALAVNIGGDKDE